jgi:hypothetical protein
MIALSPGAAGGKIAGEPLQRFEMGEVSAIVGATPSAMRV